MRIKIKKYELRELIEQVGRKRLLSFDDFDEMSLEVSVEPSTATDAMWLQQERNFGYNQGYEIGYREGLHHSRYNSSHCFRCCSFCRNEPDISKVLSDVLKPTEDLVKEILKLTKK